MCVFFPHSFLICVGNLPVKEEYSWPTYVALANNMSGIKEIVFFFLLLNNKMKTQIFLYIFCEFVSP